MPNPNEAREEAWRAWAINHRASASSQVFGAGWDARGRYDEQWIAELAIETAIERLERARQMVADLCEGKQRWVMKIPADPQRDPDLVIVAGIDSALVALRALGQSEEVKP